MSEFTYAHRDTSGGERESSTAAFNRAKLSEELAIMRERAHAREIPVSDDETLTLLMTVTRALQPEKILELGTAIGVSGAAMLGCAPLSHLTTVEKNADFYAEAAENFKKLDLESRVTAVCGDAGEIIKEFSDGTFDFIFLDCAKVQYIKYLPDLKRILKKGGTLFADDVLLFGYVTGDMEVPKKRKMLVQHVREYVDAVTDDKELQTVVLNAGNGVALSVKI